MKPYKQTSSQSCLAVCLLQNIDEEINPKKELELLYEAMATTNPSAISVSAAFIKKYDKNVLIYVDNKYYCNELIGRYKSKKMIFEYEKIDEKFLERIDLPYIVYVSTHSLIGTWDYSPHFVTVESISNKFFTILESATGKRMRIGKKKIIESISELRSRVHYCPLVIKIV